MIFGFIVLLNSLARVAELTKCLFLNDESCMEVVLEVVMSYPSKYVFQKKQETYILKHLI